MWYLLALQSMTITTKHKIMHREEQQHTLFTSLQLQQAIIIADNCQVDCTTPAAAAPNLPFHYNTGSLEEERERGGVILLSYAMNLAMDVGCSVLGVGCWGRWLVEQVDG
jgi:hypothetical protein